VWREEHYAANPEQSGMQTENQFLLDFDIEYRLRRLHYLREEVDNRLKAGNASDAGERAALKECRSSIQRLLGAMADHQRTVESPAQSPMSPALQDKGFLIAGSALLSIIALPSEEEQLKRAAVVYWPLKPMFEKAAEDLIAYLAPSFRNSSLEVGKAVDPAAYAEHGPAAQKAIADIQAAYFNFDYRDALTLPYMAGTSVDETGQVGIFRVSPADASLHPRGECETKLAGVKLGHFGAFLSRDWRQNDIMWGRLDGAERIVSALLPDGEDQYLRQNLVARAQAEILKEELTKDVLFLWLAQYVKDKIGPNATVEQLRVEVEKMSGAQPPNAPIVILSQLLAGGDYAGFIRQFYRLPDGPPPKTLLEWTGRAAAITGDMFRGLQSAGGALSAIGTKLKVFGVLLTNSIRFAVPNTLLDILVRYWLYLLMLAGGVMIAFGALKSAEVVSFGWMVLGAAIGLGAAREMLRNYLAGGSRWKRTLSVLGIGLAVLLGVVFGVGAITVTRWIGEQKLPFGR
jgi:hypothetical protein